MNLQLKRIRAIHGFSQEEMANALGIKKSRYGTWERGERMMSLEQAYNCAVILNCTIDEIAGRAPVRSYSDPRQQAMNEQYEAMNESGQSQAAQAVENAHANARNRKSVSNNYSESVA